MSVTPLLVIKPENQTCDRKSLHIKMSDQMSDQGIRSECGIRMWDWDVGLGCRIEMSDRDVESGCRIGMLDRDFSSGCQINERRDCHADRTDKGSHR